MNRDILQLQEAPRPLRATNRELTKHEILSPEIQHLIADMKEIMRAAPGVGLAAPQIGVNLKLAVIEDPEEWLKDIPVAVLQDRARVPVEFHVIINPSITQRHGDIKYFFEGCLSVKGKVRVTPRHERVTVICLDECANERVIEATGWYARILQHEIGHLNGVLYVDISDERLEMLVNEEFKSEWMNASSYKISDLRESLI